MEPEEFDDLLRRLTAMLVKQDGINDRLTAAIERLEGSMDTSMTRTDNYMARMDNYMDRMDNYMARMDNYMDRMEGYMRQQEAVNTSVSSTLADIKTLLQRVVRGSGNGREA
jgi:hypothetical protein